MQFIYKHTKAIISCVILCIFVVITLVISFRSDYADEEVAEEINESAELYEEVIAPAMLSDGVSTTFTIEDDYSKVELRYAISGINSLVSYYSNDANGLHMIEMWNNMEQYYVRVISNTDEEVYKVEITDDTRDEMLGYIYSYYIMASSYLGVASKERIVSFDQVDDNTYTAKSQLEDFTYSLRFVITDDILTDIYMFEDIYEDRSVKIHFDKFNINDQSDYMQTENTCDVDFVSNMFEYVGDD